MKYSGGKMEKNSNYKKLIKINQQFQLGVLIFIVSIIFIILSRKPYDLNLTIIKMVSCTSLIFIFLYILKKRIQKIILEECDYEANLLYLNKI